MINAVGICWPRDVPIDKRTKELALAFFVNSVNYI